MALVDRMKCSFDQPLRSHRLPAKASTKFGRFIQTLIYDQPAAFKCDTLLCATTQRSGTSNANANHCSLTWFGVAKTTSGKALSLFASCCLIAPVSILMKVISLIEMGQWFLKPSFKIFKNRLCFFDLKIFGSFKMIFFFLRFWFTCSDFEGLFC